MVIAPGRSIRNEIASYRDDHATQAGGKRIVEGVGVEVLALIPARSGSKGIPHKNIALFHGLPLLAHSVKQAKSSRSVTRVIVSTDSELYAEIARQHGAETPFLRPAEIAGDLATDLETFQHAVRWLREHEGYRPEICVHLRPTHPIRTAGDIDRVVDLLASDSSYDSVRTVVKAPETPFKMWFMEDQGALKPVIPSDLYEPYNQPRQALPATYLQNASIDAVRTRVIEEQNSMTGRNIRGLLMEQFHDIDDSAQLTAAMASAEESLRSRKFVFDFDGVIGTITPANDYNRAEPIQPNIDLVNRLFDRGNRIVICTARGFETGMDWSKVTVGQLERWGVKYHKLLFGKPSGDYYIDDRSIALKDLQILLERAEASDKVR